MVAAHNMMRARGDVHRTNVHYFARHAGAEANADRTGEMCVAGCASTKHHAHRTGEICVARASK
jgi:hypothetical protein